MTYIPKPPKQKTISLDKRMEYLIEWKRLFESISEDIKVVIRDQKVEHDRDFNKNCDKILKRFGHIYFLGINSSHFEIAIEIPEGYLMGYSHNHMFSNEDVDADTSFQADEEMEGVAYEPVTQSWREWYEVLCKRQEVLHESIPPPPDTNSDKSADG